MEKNLEKKMIRGKGFSKKGIWGKRNQEKGFRKKRMGGGGIQVKFQYLFFIGIDNIGH